MERRAALVGGRPLWVFLAASLALPLLGLVACAGWVVARASVSASAAADAETAVHAASALTQAAAAVQQEILPATGLAGLADPTLGQALQLPAVFVASAADQLRDRLSAARARTDEALAGAVEAPGAAGVATDVAARLADLRTAIDAQASRAALTPLYAGMTALTDDLVRARQQVMAQATTDDLTPATTTALRDLDAGAAYAKAASTELVAFLTTAMDGEGASTTVSWAAARTELDRATGRLDEVGDPALAARWAALDSGAGPRLMDSTLTGDPVLPSFVTLGALLSADDERNAAASRLLTAAAEAASASAEADRAAALQERTFAIAGAVTITVAAALLAWRTSRRVTRSLLGVARRAVQVSQGELVDVPVSGPREVRLVAATLGEVVDSLVRIQDQAGAVTRGELDDPSLADALPGPLGRVVHDSVVQLVESVREHDRLQTELAHQASHDPLTDLPNRAQALRLTRAALARGQRAGAAVGMLFIDLDGFKVVNDRHGHAAGDQLLRAVAQRLESQMRAGDTVCRLGGDEFVAVVEGGDETVVHVMAERLVQAVAQPATVRSASGAQVHVSVGASVGMAMHQDGELDADTLLAQADAAAYLAKQRGRGRVEVFDESLRLRIARKRDLEDALALGIERGEMRLQYQPVVTVDGGSLVGYEALVRWDRPGFGTLPPDDFVPVAEESELVCTLDRWVLHEACSQLMTWRSGNPDALSRTMAVNISGRHLADPLVVEHVAEALAATGLPPGLLVLEVTETVLVDSPTAVQHMASLRSLGVAVAIDDFGTGYTSIGQLGTLPVDTLKIDRSFVGSDDPASRSLLNLMIRTAHALGMTVVGEGVERPEDLAALLAEGCQHAQGYLMARPLTAAGAGEVFGLETSLVPAPRTG
ncbi:diguanylate cyclase (GGDEF) domain-containing protein [Klenkia marina]|uniref:Diguanylate cyclase (GGDEF) domain-containing protein n=1 Tax=Klenkia marina TaxID=1960309 RepID=A0A1G4YBY7_9ACTN|nr:EAL domain-containing protein [Klenkia marina]SCX50912.1 diguanylate cyclase (GGDEF) domain-containing protein [Klenkia marina]